MGCLGYPSTTSNEQPTPSNSLSDQHIFQTLPARITVKYLATAKEHDSLEPGMRPQTCVGPSPQPLFEQLDHNGSECSTPDVGGNAYVVRTCVLFAGPLEVASCFVAVKVEDQKNAGFRLLRNEGFYGFGLFLGFLLSILRASCLQLDELELRATVSMGLPGKQLASVHTPSLGNRGNAAHKRIQSVAPVDLEIHPSDG